MSINNFYATKIVKKVRHSKGFECYRVEYDGTLHFTVEQANDHANWLVLTNEIRKIRHPDGGMMYQTFDYYDADNQKEAQDYVLAQRISRKEHLNRKFNEEMNRMTITMSPQKAAARKVMTVEAMSEEHAKLMVSGLVGIAPELIISVDTQRKPRPAKTCSTEDYPAKGTRKWVTEYQVYSYAQRIPIGRNKYMYTNLQLQAEGFPQKAEAMKSARDLAIVMQLPMTVKLIKRLEDDENTTADVTPKTTLGKFNVHYNE